MGRNVAPANIGGHTMHTYIYIYVYVFVEIVIKNTLPHGA